MENLITAQNVPEAPHPFVRRFSLRAAAVVVFFAALWGILWWQLSGEWSVNDQYSYGWFVPLFAIVLFWLRFEDAPQHSAAETPSSAIALTIVTFLLFFPIRLFEIGNPDWRPLSWLHALCVVSITLVFLWSAGGTQWLRHFAFPVAFTLIAVPWVSPIEQPLVTSLESRCRDSRTLFRQRNETRPRRL